MTDTKGKATSRATTTETPASSTKETILAENLVDASNQALCEMIQQVAYLIAEKNGFAGDAVTYWLEAEAQVKSAQ